MRQHHRASPRPYTRLSLVLVLVSFGPAYSAGANFPGMGLIVGHRDCSCSRPVVALTKITWRVNSTRPFVSSSAALVAVVYLS